ncbi:hypothetical protein SNE40_007408 [Patella caerulea]|uniref:HECT-type E3 ubiquitin transferase n=1 Tax=Patella caerulea TaxID=87958 RepID=A0AAN8JXV3_PATCE
MATISDGETTVITCPTCDHCVAQAAGSRRTICPNCGNFYNNEAAERPPSYNRRSRVVQECNKNNNSEESSRSGGGLQTISNFFNNLGPNRKSNSGSSKSNNEGNKTELPPINGNNKVTNRSNGPAYLSPHSPAGSQSSSDNPAQRNIGSSGSNNRVIYPVRTKTAEQLIGDIQAAWDSEDWKSVKDFYTTTFESVIELNAAFKRDPNKEYKTIDDSGLKFDFINVVYDNLIQLPQDVQKDVLKAIINSLLKDKRHRDHRVWPHSKDDLRGYLILLQNPQFRSTTTYVIFAHLLRQIAALSDHDHHFLVHWIKKLEKDRFKGLLDRLHNFISVRLFPPRPQDLPQLPKCSWWIPSATKVMALLNAANTVTPVLPHTAFYNSTLDHLDLMAEYYAWQNPSSHAGFSFCQYPFILSIAAKRTILQRDSEQQMIIMARKSLVAKVQRRQLPDIGMLFLNLNVRRSYLVSDSLNEIARKQHDLKKKLKVTFTGEPGLDMGGLTKEWFLLLIRQIFQQEHGMFLYDKKSGVYWFNPSPRENYQEFNLVGVLMGLAVYNSINLDVRFPPSCYKKLLNPAVVPFSNPRATVGVTTFTLEDLKLAQPDVAKGLQDLLDYSGDVEEDFCLTFLASYTDMGNVITTSLKPDGEKVNVTAKNRKEYVNLYVDWILNKAIYPHFQAFYHGFHSVCASNALIMLRPEEVEMLVCGNPTIDLAELQKVAVYDGYNATDQIIKTFWDLVINMTVDLQKKLLLFTTGSDRIPIGGMSEMHFKITRVDGSELLPMAHTCFNQLVLPPYKSRKVLKQKLLKAINNAEGFGLE